MGIANLTLHSRKGLDSSKQNPCRRLSWKTPALLDEHKKQISTCFGSSMCQGFVWKLHGEHMLFVGILQEHILRFCEAEVAGNV